jgi:TonB family protein
VEIVVGAAGNVVDAKVIESPHPELDGFAVEAALRSVFSPPMAGFERTVVVFQFPPETTEF